MFGLKITCLEFDHEITAQFKVVKQQIHKKAFSAHLKRYLPPDKGKACAQF